MSRDLTDDIKNYISREFKKQCATEPMPYWEIITVGVLIVLWWVGAWGIADSAVGSIADYGGYDRSIIYLVVLVGSTLLLEVPFKKLQAALSWDT
jgi:hypothetical protein